ncbi:MAG: biotin--[acetyl-CoA-carboxylase] ligase [Ruminococcaceae bacterium]|nr:biotin--[acetyl-CoA-carboxylase] ligase [Oscillospiraceae bacterium]
MTYISTPDLQIALGRYADTVQIKLYDTVNSTNTAAKSEALESVSPALYIARTQTGGRGRLGRSFHSPADTGLYMTVAYTTDKPLAEAVRVTAGASVAAVRAIEAATDKRPAIKWVNDLYLCHAKIGGILTEAVTLPEGCTRMVVGLGINLTTSEFPEGLRAPAASLFSPAEVSAATPAFMGTLAGEITRRLLELTEGGLWESDCLDFYRSRLLYVDTPVLCTRGSEAFEGILRGVDENFSLLVETDGKIRALSSGEISVRPRPSP